MFFDVKMKHFWQKAQLIARGHSTKAPAAFPYGSVMSQETVCIALLLAALNDIDICAADVLNTYITVPCNKKIWTLWERVRQ